MPADFDSVFSIYGLRILVRSQIATITIRARDAIEEWEIGFVIEGPLSLWEEPDVSAIRVSSDKCRLSALLFSCFASFHLLMHRHDCQNASGIVILLLLFWAGSERETACVLRGR